MQQGEGTQLTRCITIFQTPCPQGAVWQTVPPRLVLKKIVAHPFFFTNTKWRELAGHLLILYGRGLTQLHCCCTLFQSPIYSPFLSCMFGSLPPSKV